MFAKGAFATGLAGLVGTGAGALAKPTHPPVVVDPTARDVEGLPLVDRPSDHPAHKEVLTVPGGPLEVRGVDQDKIVALRVDDGTVIALYTNRIGDRLSRQALEVAAREKHLRVACYYEAPASYIREFYFAKKTQTASPDEPRGEMDELIDEIVGRALLLGASDILLHSGMGAHPGTINFIVHKRVQYYRTIAQDRLEYLARALYAKAASDSKGVTFNARTGQDAKVMRKLLVDGQERQVALRYAGRPVRDRFDLVLRVLNEDGQSRYESMEQCGYWPEQRKLLARQNGRASGLVLMVGTTGSGKSTTMKVMIEEFAATYKSQKHIVTVEDPIEYVIRGARQTGVVQDDQAGTETAARKKNPYQQALEWMLRSAPHAIFIGELRNRETVTTAQKAVQTGHKVWSTLHAQSAFVALDRLIDEGADRSVVYSPGFINAIVYQVLLPSLCPDCKRPWGTEAGLAQHADLHQGILRAAKLLEGNLDMVFVEGNNKDCKRCRGTGVVGVLPCAEILVPDDEILHLMAHGERLAAEKYWRGRVNNAHPGVTGVTALEHGLKRMFRGEVSPFAIESEILPVDDLADPAQEREDYKRAVPHRLRGNA